MALAGCSASTLVNNGTPVLTLSSDAAGDFSSYVVGLYTITLTRSDGYVTYVQSSDQQVDLTRRTDLSELFSAIGAPTGSYTSASIVLDFSNPVVYLKGQTTPASVKSAAGTTNPGLMTLTVKFDPSHPLVISLNKSTPLAIDVDLAASNSISGNTVTVKPFVVATVLPVATAPVRARGIFVMGNPSSGNFIENIRPFDDTYYGDGPVGALTVNTTAGTYFNINGTTYMGSAGLTAMAALNNSEVVTAYGTLGDLSTITPALDATAVYAGTSTISAGAEVVRGYVSARSGNSLTVQGAQYVCQEGPCFSNAAFTLYPTATVNIGVSTVVSEDGVAASGLTTQSISIGQKIQASGLGTVSGSTLTVDATSGHVRLQMTPAFGTLTSGTVGSATLNLLEIGPFAPSTFHFSGTGTSSANDANPASYTVNIGSIDASTLAAGSLLEPQGFVSPFGSAPPDFNAASLTDLANGPTTLIVEWTAGTPAPFTSSGSAGLVVNLLNSAITTAIMRTGPQSVALSSLPSSPTIVPGCPSTCSGNSEYAIGNMTNGITVFNSASAFLSGLSSTLNGSTAVFKLVAIGTYDSTSNTFFTQRMDLALK